MHEKGFVTSADRLASMNTERDQQKIQRLLKIKENIETIAKKDAEKYQNLIKKNEKRDKLAKEYKKALLMEAKMKKQKHEARLLQAKDSIQKTMIANEQKGVKIYNQYIREVESKLDDEKKKEKE